MSDYSAVKQSLAHIVLPKFFQVRYDIPLGPPDLDPALATRATLESTGLLERILPGQSVAVSVSSREIAGHAQILRELVRLLKARGAKPFLFPAMGSHGGATAEGQRALAQSYGIDEQTIGCPLHSSMEVTLIGHTPKKNLPVHLDKIAAQADHLIPVGRIKAHTDFRGKVESGLMKMLAIGCGKQQGAFLCHHRGWDEMAENVYDIGEYILQNHPVPFGVGIIEDSAHNLAAVQAVAAENIPREEPKLLELAKSYIPSIPFEKIDVLIVDEIGKDISGAGMDPNVTGRSAQMGQSAPFAERIVIRGLTAKTKHNAAGVGNGDVITQRLYQDIDLPATYINGITSHDAYGCRIPPVMPDDDTAFRYALELAMGADPAIGHRVVWIKNTSSMARFYITENLRREAGENPKITVSNNGQPISFDHNGNATDFIHPFEYGQQ